MPRLLRIKKYSLETTRQHPDKVFVFGDNLQGTGSGWKAGQAVIRPAKNSYGIPTKKKPTMNRDAFMTDLEYESNVKAIDAAIAKIPKDRDLVMPKDGIGTGRALLKQNAPKTWSYLQQELGKLRKNYEQSY